MYLCHKKLSCSEITWHTVANATKPHFQLHYLYCVLYTVAIGKLLPHVTMMKNYGKTMLALGIVFVAVSSVWADFPVYAGSSYTVGSKMWSGFSQVEEAANQSDPLACFVYAWALEEGRGVRKNEALAREWYAKAADGLKKLASQGNSDAMAALADLYEAGNGVPKNKVEAAKWYAKAAAAGHAYALYALAECYKDGNGVPQSTDKARELYSQAAEKGYSPARSALLDLDEEEK